MSTVNMNVNHTLFSECKRWFTVMHVFPE